MTIRRPRWFAGIACDLGKQLSTGVHAMDGKPRRRRGSEEGSIMIDDVGEPKP